MKKMVMAVVPRDQASRVLECLVDTGYSTTYMESRGGMLRQSQQSLFIVVEEEQLEHLLGIFRGDCGGLGRTRTIGAEVDAASKAGPEELTGGVVFVWSIDHVETY
ncbi:MAG: cyclic-di-AMP receptor [Anaerolineales bacterium]|nr:cyclic-di-AMP receptor [Anaerolineales bacterium]